MGWCIESVKTNLQAFSESLISQGVDARFAVIEFSDAINYPGSTKIYQLEGGSYWTSNVTLLEAGLNRAIQEQYYNPGWDETPNDACYALINGLSSTFRTDASRFAFLMTDEGNNVVASDPRLQGMGTYASMLKNRDIHTSVVSLGNLRGDFEVLCTATGGMYIDLRSSDYYKVMLSVADWVAEVTGLTVHVMERASLSDNDNNGSPSTPNLICDARKAVGYYDGNGSRITEKKLANITNPDTYTRNGYTADGNTRLIIRVQHNRPGIVYFDVGSEFGTLEDINRNKINSSIPIPTTKIQDGKLYQASAVLVAPESFPLKGKVLGLGDDGFPKREFELKVKFKCGCGDSKCTCEDEENPVTLQIHATPVVFVHGIYGNFAGTFVGKGKSGVFMKLNYNGMSIGAWDYNASEGPTNLIIDKIRSGEHSGLFQVISRMFRMMLIQHNVACTRVDVICHSMGGLMARTFLEYEDKSSSRSYYNNMVRRLITIATPHEGSPTTTYLLGKGAELPYIVRNNPSYDQGPHGVMERVLLDNNLLEPVRNAVRRNLDGREGATDAVSAWTDLALDSVLVRELRSVGVPPVPTRVIYGTIRDGTPFLFDLVGTLGSVLVNFPQVFPPDLRAMIEVAPQIVSSAENLSAFFDVLLNEEDYDPVVGEDSAISIFNPRFITHYNGENLLTLLRYHHTAISLQDNVGDEVLSLLKGDLSNFDTSGVGKTNSSSFSMSAMANTPVATNAESHREAFFTADTGEVSDYFLTKYTLSIIDPDGLEYTAPDTLIAEASRDVTFTLTAEDPAEHDIYLSIGNESGGSFLQMTSADDTLTTFTASMTLPSEYSGTMKIHAFSSPNAGDEGHVYISDTLEIKILPEIDDSDPIQELSFTGNSVIIAGTSYDIGLNLFAVTQDGRYIDVSVPEVAGSLGIYTSFADSTIAELTEYGKIRGLKSGRTTFRANYGSIEASISIDVDVKCEMSSIPEATSKDLFITTSSLQNGKAGLAYTQILESTLSFTDPVVWTASGLPAGLICGADGVINGKPLTSGTYSIDITVSNDTEIDSKTLKLTVRPSDNPLAPIISTLSLPSGIVNREYTAEISAVAQGDTSAMLWSIYSGTIPEGLNFEEHTGGTITLSGIPKTSGSFTFMMMATINGYSDMQSFTVLINDPDAPKIITSSLPGGTEGTPYNAVIEASGTPPLVWSVARGKLPNGLTLSADTGIISGIPSASGDFSFTVSAMNDAGKASANFKVSIAPSSKAVSPDFKISALPEGRIGIPYSAKITVSGTKPLTISLTSGEIPDGLNFSNDVISGTPSRSGTFKLTFTVSNIAGSVSRTFILTINQAPEDVKSDDNKPGGQTEINDSKLDEQIKSDDSKPGGQTKTDDSKPDEQIKSDDSKPKDNDNNIVIGPARGVASLSAVELAMVSNDRSMIAAILPEITVNVSALYSFEGIEIDAKVPAGYVLVWNAFARVSGSEIKASDEREAMFTDESGQEITTVPNSHIINVSAYLEAGNTYAPVVSALIPDDRKVGVENSSGGCSVVPSILILAAFGIFVGRKK